MGLLLAGSLLLLAAGAALIARTSLDALTPVFTAVLLVFFAGALGAAGAANAWTGRALRTHRSTGRTLALGLAVLNLFVLPFGTALGIYSFWVLLHNDSRALFEPHPPASGA
jgi:hypothetical protein